MGYNVRGQYEKFIKAVDACKQGQWGPREMADFLTRTSQSLQPKAQFIYETLDTEGYRDGALEECDCAESSIEHYEEGMGQMWEYTNDGNLEHLQLGLKTIKQGNELMNRAMNLNRDAYEELEIQFFL